MPFRALSKRAWNDLQDVSNWSPTGFFPKDIRSDEQQPLRAGSPYLTKIFSWANCSRPDLRFLRDELQRQLTEGNVHNRSRATVIEFSNEGAGVGIPRPFQNPSDLHDYWQENQTPLDRLYVLEDVTSGFVEEFGRHFSLDPSFFATHLRSTNWESSESYADSSKLPSSTHHTSAYSIWYPETLVFPAQNLQVEDHDDYYFCYSNLYRQISFVRGPKYRNSRVGQIMRKVSIFVKKLENNTQEGLIIVDPPIGLDIYTQQGINVPMKRIGVEGIRPYKGGFIDFSTWWCHDSEPITNCTSPGRQSMFDDIIYYATMPGRKGGLRSGTLATISSTNCIAAGMWANALEYVKENVSKLEFMHESARSTSTSRWAPKSHKSLSLVEESLQEISHWKRMCSVYQERIEHNIDGLQKHFSMTQDGTGTLSAESKDWQYLAKAIEGWNKRSSDNVQATFALLSVIGSQKSVDEAENARLLAILGTVYLPFSLAAGILSMGGEFAPGNGKFWIYFPIAASLLLFSLVPAFAPRLQITISNFLSERGLRKAAKENIGRNTGKSEVQV
ncbi:hypothetical protein B0J11DRAFT_545267 [Dendryphion nanum]|uniref:Uncharacterized protein n=1 Tax=Dendryphion nanum TaxID=256645 RepID=A0A9P9CXU3_9PLEO|nr:hypothetical protein B0J11DRAFT_545267 [Dendryphion nanum]